MKNSFSASLRGQGVLLAVLAAALYAVNTPFSKLLLSGVSPTMLAGLLYLGAGVGMGALLLTKRLLALPDSQARLARADLPYTVAMVALDIAAPIFLMFGIAATSPANVSLLNNFEIVATSVIAFAVFGERISRRLWLAIVLVVAASAILGFEGVGALSFDRGSLLVLCACLCWGVENNCTRSISHKSSQQIVLVKGLGSGAGSVVTALLLGEQLPKLWYLLAALALGFVAYGLSINFYIMAQKRLGAAKTSAFYSIAPFLGVGFSFLLLRESPEPQFWAALVIMLAATAVMVKDTLKGD